MYRILDFGVELLVSLSFTNVPFLRHYFLNCGILSSIKCETGIFINLFLASSWLLLLSIKSGYFGLLSVESFPGWRDGELVSVKFWIFFYNLIRDPLALKVLNMLVKGCCVWVHFHVLWELGWRCFHVRLSHGNVAEIVDTSHS
jgi:hypothetical protein